MILRYAPRRIPDKQLPHYKISNAISRIGAFIFAAMVAAVAVRNYRERNLSDTIDRRDIDQLDDAVLSDGQLKNYLKYRQIMDQTKRLSLDKSYEE
ncbi:hypothetical protein ACOME3_009509 [Neoechinorhynchus agilis]